MKPATAPPEFFSADVARARRFYLDLNPPRRALLVVVCGGVEHTTPGYAIHRATFPYYSIEYVARGHGELELNRRRYPLRPGRVFSYAPRVPHHIRSRADNPLVKYFVDFAGRGAVALLRSCGLQPGRVSQVFPAHALQGLFDELIESGQRGSRAGTELCVRLLECLGLKISDARAPLAGTENLAFATYQQCRQHIAEHFLRLRTLGELSAECHLSGAHLCRLFRRFDHQSPYQYLLRLKINAAAERLAQPGALVKQVAEEVGFPDAFHFSRVFKSLMGLPPADFRQLR